MPVMRRLLSDYNVKTRTYVLDGYEQLAFVETLQLEMVRAGRAASRISVCLKLCLP